MCSFLKIIQTSIQSMKLSELSNKYSFFPVPEIDILSVNWSAGRTCKYFSHLRHSILSYSQLLNGVLGSRLFSGMFTCACAATIYLAFDLHRHFKFLGV